MNPPSFGDFANVIRRVFDRNDIEISPQTRSVDVPGWDSLSHVMLIIELQGEYDVNIQPDETVEMQDVGALYELLIARIG